MATQLPNSVVAIIGGANLAASALIVLNILGAATGLLVGLASLFMIWPKLKNEWIERSKERRRKKALKKGNLP